MKKVLVIAYHFPPSTKVGALRSRGIAKYLPEFGWEPFFIVPLLPGKPPAGFNIIETHPPYQKMLNYCVDRENRKQIKRASHILPPLYGKIYSFFRGFVEFPDNRVGWLPFAYESAKETITKEKIRHMLTIFGPATCHLAGYQVKKRYPDTLWLADYRDPWTIYYKNTFMNRYEQKLERHILNSADAISTVSPSWTADYQNLFPDKKTYTIPNGFDPVEMNPGTGVTDKEFTITHTGELYRNTMSPEPLFKALSELFSENKMPSFSLRFYGDKQNWLIPVAEKYNIRRFVNYFGRIERSKILEIQRKSQVLFIPEVVSIPEAKYRKDRGGKGRLTAKIYEYLASMRPILYTGKSDSDIAHLLQQTGAGVVCPDTDAIKRTILTWYNQWKEKGRAGYTGIKKEIMKHSHREMARRFAESLENM